MRITTTLLFAGLFTIVSAASAQSQTKSAAEKKPAAQKPATQVWTDPADPSIPTEFELQGEYMGAKLGCQVIALGNGALQAVLLPGGLPGEGWDGKNKLLLAGKIEGENAVFDAATGERKYLAASAEEFSATAQFPPAGQKGATATLRGGLFSGKIDGGEEFQLRRVERKSPTLGVKPPSDAVVLFDGSNADQWNRGRVDEKTGVLNTDGGDLLTKRKFNNYVMHLEFMLPFRPDARGQGRGNSGFYQVDHYEVQVLDSFGLDGKNNECGGVYTKAEPRINMCYPPLTWQTYDVEFINAVAENGKKVKNARMTLRHNGIVIHDDLEITGTTGGSRSEPEGTPGPIKLQGHGNPLQYRNIWIVEKP